MVGEGTRGIPGTIPGTIAGAPGYVIGIPGIGIGITPGTSGMKWFWASASSVAGRPRVRFVSG